MGKDNQKDLHSLDHSLAERLNPDRALLALVTRNRRQFLTRSAIFFTKIGNGQLWLAFSLVVFLYSIPNGLSFFIAAFTQLYIQVFIKSFIKRARPYKVYRDLVHLYAPPDPYSFPSGHTAAAFTMFFTSLSVLPFMWPYFLLVALGIAVSRIYLAVHYPSDIIGGVVIGYFAASIGVLLASVFTGTIL